MSHESAPPPEQVTLQVEAIERETRAVQAALVAGHRYRLLLVVLLLLVAVVSVSAFFRLFQRFQEKEQLDALLKQAESRLTARSDLVTREVETLVNNAAPKVSAAFGERAKQDLPQFLQAAGVERDALVANLQAKLEPRLKAHYQKLLERQATLFAEEFPEIQDPKLREAMLAKAAATLPAGRVGQPGDLAAGYLFVIDNPFVTGAVIDIEGGALVN